MSEEKHHRGLFHHKKAEDEPAVVAYSEETYTEGSGGYGDTYSQDHTAVKTPEVDYERQEKQHKNKERLSELGALAAGGYALYEKHEAKKDPENARRHKIEEEAAAAAAVGAGGFAFHERHEKKEAKEEEEETQGKKHHHLF